MTTEGRLVLTPNMTRVPIGLMAIGLVAAVIGLFINSERVWLNLLVDGFYVLSLGVSGMTGTYDPENQLGFVLLGADFVMRLDPVFLRAEYLVRRTEMSLGDDPASRFRYGPGEDGEFDDFFVKEGWYAELEVPIGRVDLVGRWDGLRRRGNVARQSPLRSDSILFRSTAAFAYRLHGALRLKLSAEIYDFSDFDDELALHLGIAGPF